MRINHHIGINYDDVQLRRFAKVGVDLSQHRGDSDSTLAVFDVFEDDRRYPEIRTLISEMGGLDVTWTVFSKQELQAAEFLTFDKCWESGYPQPEEEYDSITYSREDFCSLCGTGLKQQAPFKIKGEPKWGRRSFLRLNWVPDEIFTTPQVWAEVFKPHGIECMPILHSRTKEELKTCVQLVVDEHVELEIPSTHRSEFCAVCGIRRWDIFSEGFYPGPKSETSLHMFKSSQYFGTGHASWRHVLVSQAIFDEISGRKLKGAEFAACAK